MGAVFTNTGLERFQLGYINGTDVTATRVRVGTLDPAQRYDAAATATGLVDQTPTILSIADAGLVLNGAGPRVSYDINVTYTQALRGSEVGLYDDAGRLLILWADQDEDVFNKLGDQHALLNIRFEYRNGVPSNLTVEFRAIAVATNQQMLEANNDVTVVSPRGLHYWYNQLAVATTKLAGVLPSRVYDWATKPEAEAGSIETKPMNPARTKDAIEALVPKASEAQYKARSDSSVYLTPDSIPEPQVDTFNGSGTWTKPTGARLVHALVISGGGGGMRGGGRGAGFAGVVSQRTFRGEDVPASVPVTIGAGGTGGASGGTSGGASSFGSILASGGGNGAASGGTLPSPSLLYFIASFPGNGGMVTSARVVIPRTFGIVGIGGAFNTAGDGGDGAIPGGAGGNSINALGGDGARGRVVIVTEF